MDDGAATSTLECPNCERLTGEVERLRAELERLQRMVQDLEAANAELRRRLDQNSANSHRPPSSDPPGSKPPRRKTPSGRSPGGQPGHEGKTRGLIPAEEVDEIQEVKPDACSHCGAPLQGDDPAPGRHQVIEIPPLSPHVTEFRVHSLCCATCSEMTRAELPRGVPSSTYGPRLQSLVALLTGAYRLSKRNARQLLSDLLDVPISVGSIVALERATSEALADPVAEAKAAVQVADVVGVDETGWKEGDKRAWLWVAVTQFVAVFVIRASRGAKVATELLGEAFGGTTVSDRWSAYGWIGVYFRQVCWAHLKRDFQKLIDSGDERAGEIGQGLQKARRRLFAWAHRVRDGTLARSTFGTYTSRVRKEIRGLLEAGASCGHPATQGFCRKLLPLEPALYAFVRSEAVPPTNNEAERALRHAVIWRKTSFGTQNGAGTLYVERMLTVVTTLRLQHRNVLEFLAEASQAFLERRPAPSILPPHTAAS